MPPRKPAGPLRYFNSSADVICLLPITYVRFSLSLRVGTCGHAPPSVSVAIGENDATQNPAIIDPRLAVLLGNYGLRRAIWPSVSEHRSPFLGLLAEPELCRLAHIDGTRS